MWWVGKAGLEIGEMDGDLFFLDANLAHFTLLNSKFCNSNRV